jgi:NAD(P)H-nitrite reductase large subunit
VAIHTHTKINGLINNKALARQQDGTTIHFPVETVVMAVGVRPTRNLAGALEHSELEMNFVGDAL